MKMLLVEDHPIFRFGVRQLIQQRWPEAVCLEASTQESALTAATANELTLAVVDLNLPDAEGVEVVSKLLRAKPGLRILVLSLNAEEAYAQHVLRLGAAGYLAKDRAGEELVTAIERVASGGRYITSSLAEHLLEIVDGQQTRQPHEELSVQEYRVMIHLVAGRRINEIAEAMTLSPKTVSTYRGRILEKLKLTSNTELARYCIKNGLE